MKPARLAPADAVPATVLPPPWPGRPVVLDGAVTYVRRTPSDGPGSQPALYVHGLGGSSQNWTDLAGLLSSRLDGQAIDLPGFGRSDPAPRYTISAAAGRVIRWIEYADRGPVHLFGNSLGGAITVRVAARRPDLVRSLVLISPAMPFLDPRRSVQGRLVPLLLLPRVELLVARRLAQIDPVELAAQVLQACFADLDRLSPQRLAEAQHEARLRHEVPWFPQAYVGTMRGLVTSFLRAGLPGSGSLWRLAGQVSVPTLVIGGDRDQLVDARVAPRVARTIPDARLLILPGVGHVAQMEVPDIVARAAIGLLDELAARRRDPAPPYR